MIDSYLLGAGTLADNPAVLDRLCVGTRLDLRPSGRSRVEVRLPDGHTLGWLPPEDAWTVLDLMRTGASTKAHVRGLVPAFRRPRIQLAIEIGVTSK
jgi:hypothetical protein